ncbi:MAG: PEP/pyruvate-binding domain-containing protein, partial [Myxococcota bacterium]
MQSDGVEAREASGGDLARPILLSNGSGSSVAEIGGKAASLVRLAASGFRVPEGVVLPAAWFSRWWEELRATLAWARFAQAGVEPLGECCTAVQAAARELRYAAEMRSALDEVERLVASWGAGATCAVRSSSPEEDLAGASFAGGYVTVLGVAPDGIESAVRECFVSALDERVVVYKQQYGFDIHQPSIAVLVQRQVESEVAGVGFSLNPITNDFDEAVIDANFGLGESVVSGEVTPDHFVVDKPGREILERRLGSKALSRWVQPGGGVVVRECGRSGEASLSDAQVLELTEVLERLEVVYGYPVDIEWAYAHGELHLLQSRPVTAYMPLAPEMQTAPGARRRLYQDGALSDGPTTNRPLTRLSLDSFDLLIGGVCARFGVPYDEDEPEDGSLYVFAGSRIYVDFSKVLWLISPKRMVGLTELMDPLLGRTLMALDRERYMPERRPSVFSPLLVLRTLARGLWKGRRILWLSLLSFVSVTRFMRGFREEVRDYEQAVADLQVDVPISDLRALNDRFITVLMEAGMPAIYPWSTAAAMLEGARKKAKTPEIAALLDSMNRGFEGELIIDMGIQMFALTRLIDASEFEDIEALGRKIQARSLPEAFLHAWDEFVLRYGCRGPLEMELRSPRYGDTPELLLHQLATIAKAPESHDPGIAHERAVEERKRATASLLSGANWLQRRYLNLIARWIDAYAGERDTPKHHWVMLATAMRHTVLALGERLVKADRLDTVDDVFHLTWAELEAAESDPALDIRSLALEHGRSFRRVES